MSDERPDTAPSPVHRPHERSGARNVIDEERQARPDSDGVHIGRRSLSGLAKVLAALATVASALGAGWGGHHLAGADTEAKIAATQKQFEEHVARAEAQRLEIMRVNERRDADVQAMQVNLAGIAQSLADLRSDVHDIKESLDDHPRRQPRNRPTPARTRVDEH